MPFLSSKDPKPTATMVVCQFDTAKLDPKRCAAQVLDLFRQDGVCFVRQCVNPAEVEWDKARDVKICRMHQRLSESSGMTSVIPMVMYGSNSFKPGSIKDLDSGSAMVLLLDEATCRHQSILDQISYAQLHEEHREPVVGAMNSARGFRDLLSKMMNSLRGGKPKADLAKEERSKLAQAQVQNMRPLYRELLTINVHMGKHLTPSLRVTGQSARLSSDELAIIAAELDQVKSQQFAALYPMYTSHAVRSDLYDTRIVGHALIDALQRKRAKLLSVEAKLEALKLATADTDIDSQETIQENALRLAKLQGKQIVLKESIEKLKEKIAGTSLRNDELTGLIAQLKTDSRTFSDYTTARQEKAMLESQRGKLLAELQGMRTTSDLSKLERINAELTRNTARNAQIEHEKAQLAAKVHQSNMQQEELRHRLRTAEQAKAKNDADLRMFIKSMDERLQQHAAVDAELRKLRAEDESHRAQLAALRADSERKTREYTQAREESAAQIAQLTRQVEKMADLEKKLSVQADQLAKGERQLSEFRTALSFSHRQEEEVKRQLAEARATWEAQKADLQKQAGDLETSRRTLNVALESAREQIERITRQREEADRAKQECTGQLQDDHRKLKDLEMLKARYENFVSLIKDSASQV